MIKAIIFDFDGVIIDSEPLHFKAFKKVLDSLNINFIEVDYWSKYLAMSDKDLFINLNKDRNLNWDSNTIEQLIEKKGKYFLKFIQEEPNFFHGINNVLLDLYQSFILTIASGALKHEIQFVLKKLNAEKLFKYIISAEEVQQGKPNPEIYLKAYDKLTSIDPSIKKEHCLAIEDSIHGILAAHNAGIKCIAVAHSYKEEDIAIADSVLPHISLLNSNIIKSLFS